MYILKDKKTGYYINNNGEYRILRNNIYDS